MEPKIIICWKCDGMGKFEKNIGFWSTKMIVIDCPICDGTGCKKIE